MWSIKTTLEDIMAKKPNPLNPHQGRLVLDLGLWTSQCDCSERILPNFTIFQSTFKLSSWRLFKFIFAGDLGVHYDHPLGRSDAASINFVPFDHDASQLVRVRRESPVADADYDAPHGSPASGSAIPQPSGSGNVVDNTLSTTIATTTKAPQISKRFDLCRCHFKEN